MFGHLFQIALFASDNAGRDSVLVILGGAIIAGVVKLLEMTWAGWRERRAKTDAQDEKDQSKIEAHLEIRVARLEADNDRCGKRVTRLGQRIRVLENSNTQMKAFIAGLNVDHPKYVEIPLELEKEEPDPPIPAGSDTHSPLPPTQGS